MAFIGTKGVGDTQHNGFVGDWHLYIATTADKGQTWTTVDTTPTTPLQRGCISLQGTSNKTVADPNICSQRNLLDFNDITLDKQGRVLAAYATGCVKLCQTDPKSASKGAVDMVMRETGGTLLTAADIAAGIAANAPARPAVTGGNPNTSAAAPAAAVAAP
ncbi:MAG: hypothetical protein ACR2MY_11285 [Candidatus Dormibacteria bacterium]